jgi:endonuclease/exonuclease/phosphatase (EEP) superfamily protein YafD
VLDFKKDNARLKFLPLLFAGLLVILQGCIEIPDPYLVIGQREWAGTVAAVRPCDPDSLALPPTAAPPSDKALDAGGFYLVTWNMLKGRRSGWQEDFQRLVQEGDVVLLQEAYLTAPLLEALRRAQLNWRLATAFRYQGAEAGVLTAAKTDLQGICMQRFREPLLNTPKTSLVTRLPLSDGSHLVVANVHAINFTMDAIHFLESWQELEAILQPHAGPLIVAGDFNTWNADRQVVVANATRRMGLAPVRFPSDQRTRFFDRTVDHVYYRGLVPLEALVQEVKTSDHNPMRVTFRRVDQHGD